MTTIDYDSILHHEAITYSHNEGNAYQGYIAGATRANTPTEIEAAAKTLALELDNNKWGSITRHQQFIYQQITENMLRTIRQTITTNKDDK